MLRSGTNDGNSALGLATTWSDRRISNPPKPKSSHSSRRPSCRYVARSHLRKVLSDVARSRNPLRLRESEAVDRPTTSSRKPLYSTEHVLERTPLGYRYTKTKPLRTQAKPVQTAPSPESLESAVPWAVVLGKPLQRVLLPPQLPHRPRQFHSSINVVLPKCSL